ncbi:hypothetical protein [Arsenicitalea aurantiaca]|nr:hypothetical protein [Arsenicitalea aurantiaca]
MLEEMMGQAVVIRSSLIGLFALCLVTLAFAASSMPIPAAPQSIYMPIG